MVKTKDKEKMYETKGDKIFNLFNLVLLSLFVISILYPLIFVLSASFSDPDSIAAGKVFLLPVNFNLEGYKVIFDSRNVWVGYKNTLIYTLIGSSFSVALTVLAGYALSRKDLYGRSIFTTMFVITMLFNGGLIPNYLLMNKLNLIDTAWVMVIPGALSAWYVFITKTYFASNIPDSLLEAAKLDGCSDYKFLYHIVIPLTGPIIAVVFLFGMVVRWNSYFNAMIYLESRRLFPLQLVLREILILNQTDLELMDTQDALKAEHMHYLLKYSLITVSTLPILMLYPFLQKYFVKGMLIGSVKG